MAENFIDILHHTPVQFLPASCDFIVDYFNSKQKSAIDAAAPLKTKSVKVKTTTPWRNERIKQMKQNCRRAERKSRKTKFTIHLEIFQEYQKIYNSAVKQARTLHFSNVITQNKNNPKFLFKTIDFVINTENKSSMPASDTACEDFADHFGSKINAIRSSLLSQQNVDFSISEAFFLPKETLEIFVLVDDKMLGRVFSQLNPTTCL